MSQTENFFRIGRKILALRTEVGLSQQDLADMAGISLSTLSKIESEREINPKIITLASIAHELDVGVDDLLSF